MGSMDIRIIEPVESPYFECVFPLGSFSENVFASVATQLLTKVLSVDRLAYKFRLEVEFGLQPSLASSVASGNVPTEQAFGHSPATQNMTENNNTIARMRIYLQTSAWYDIYLHPKGQAGIRIAQEYVANMIEQEVPDQEKRSYSQKKLAKYDDFDICNTYRNTGKCNSRHALPHPTFICKIRCETNDGREKNCGFFIPDSLLIKQLSKRDNSVIFKQYVLGLRRGLIRVLLLVPSGHKNNEELVKSPSFWSYLLSLRPQLGFHSVTFNFGKWESELSNNKYTQECHGHANIHFTEENWLKLKCMIEPSLHPRLDMCVNSGSNYIRADCDELDNHLQQFILQTQQSTIQEQQHSIDILMSCQGFPTSPEDHFNEEIYNENDDESYLNYLIPGDSDFHQIKISFHEQISTLKQIVKEKLEIQLGYELEVFSIECFVQGTIPTQDVISGFRNPENCILDTRRMFPDGKISEYFVRDDCTVSNNRIHIIVKLL